jgi:hypothetical protein
MKETPLKQFCEENTQNAAADIIGCTQGAVWQMLREGREVYIVTQDDGSQSAYEKKPVRGRRGQAA